MQVDNLSSLSPGRALDPAILAFVKCHITSFVKWDVLRLLADNAGQWLTMEAIAMELSRHPATVGAALHSLAAEHVIEEAAQNEAKAYRLPADDPTATVVQRLIAAATRSQELRRIVVANVLQSRSDDRLIG